MIEEVTSDKDVKKKKKKKKFEKKNEKMRRKNLTGTKFKTGR
jgi:hypothetical protein